MQVIDSDLIGSFDLRCCDQDFFRYRDEIKSSESIHINLTVKYRTVVSVGTSAV